MYGLVLDIAQLILDVPDGLVIEHDERVDDCNPISAGNTTLIYPFYGITLLGVMDKV